MTLTPCGLQGTAEGRGALKDYGGTTMNDRAGRGSYGHNDVTKTGQEEEKRIDFTKG